MLLSESAVSMVATTLAPGQAISSQQGTEKSEDHIQPGPGKQSEHRTHPSWTALCTVVTHQHGLLSVVSGCRLGAGREGSCTVSTERLLRAHSLDELYKPASVVKGMWDFLCTHTCSSQVDKWRSRANSVVYLHRRLTDVGVVPAEEAFGTNTLSRKSLDAASCMQTPSLLPRKSRCR